MNNDYITLVKRLIIVLSVFLVAGCAGFNTFHQAARAGDTVAIAAGWQENWSRDNITVYVQESGSSVWTSFPANDPSIRAVVNFYPDPLSSLVVSNRTAQNITLDAQIYGNNVNNAFTSGSRDWYNTIIFFDLPTGLALGNARIYIEEDSNPSNYAESIVQIVENVSGGKKHDFEATALGPMQRKHLASLERASHYAVNLSGTGPLPHAVQLDFAHDTGVGKAYVVEPISGLKNITWSDDGTNLRVIIMPADGKALTGFEDFKFYVAGGITNLTPVSTQAFDINGASVAGVSAPTITPYNIVISTN